MKHKNIWLGRIRKFGSTVLLLLAASIYSWTQASGPASPPPDAMTDAVRQLQDEVRELRNAVVELRTEAGQYRAETEQLRKQLEARGPAPEAGQTNPAGASSPSQPATLGERVASLEESSDLLTSKLDDQYQTKVEAASKYRLRLSGIVLLNLFSNHGIVDSQDVPTWAIPQIPNVSGQTLGASMRQSEIGLEVFGPHLLGARTAGNLQLDFAGGSPNLPNGVNFGLARLRIASMRIDWNQTSIVAGQDNAFFSPLSPSSFASLALPAFSYAGNLWGWIPQVRIEHRFNLSDGQTITLQGGIMDNVTSELPSAFAPFAQAGQSSGQPSYATRLAWSRDIFGMPLTLGAAAYYSRQNWGLGHNVDGWAGMTDWSVPLAKRIGLTGEFYRGRAIGGLGGGVGRSVLFSSDSSQVSPLNSVGGWSLLKISATNKLEFNGAFGVDSPFAADVRGFTLSRGFPAPLLQNRSSLVNVIYRPRSDLVFSGEYRHLRTFDIDAGSPTADQVNLMMGILF
ncbi:MAG TPA: bZIP transcription factor [Terriglobales bacterium]|nr:bZIP transcription factor [Terriglobales bacterium]